MTPWDAVDRRAKNAARRQRRAWVGDERAHIEVRGLQRPEALTLAASVVVALEELPGVGWAAMEPGVGRVVVSFDSQMTGLEEMTAVVEDVEQAHGAAEDRFPFSQGEHPGDREPSRRAVIALCADGAGLGLGIFGRLVRSTPLPIELASLFTLLESEPRLRRIIEASVGTPATDLGLAVGNALAQGLSQGPLGLVTDMALRANLLAEARSRRRGFADAEAKRWGAGPVDRSVLTSPGPVDRSVLTSPGPVDRSALTSRLPVTGDSGPFAPATERPRPLPYGPIERYADRALVASAGTSVVTWAATGSLRRATAMMIAGLPKVSRVGREAFAARLTRGLVARDMVVLDSGALRRLDRVDTVVIHEALLLTSRSEVTGVRLVEEAERAETHRRLSEMFDPLSPQREVVEAHWMLGPLQTSERRTLGVRRMLRDLGGSAIALRKNGRIQAIARLDEQLSSGALEVVRAAKRQGHMVAVAGSDLATLDRVGGDLLIEGGEGCAAAVRSLQEDGCGVALVAGGAAAAALRCADVGLELADLDGSPWTGDIVMDSLEDAVFVVECIGVARQVSRQSVALAISGSGLGALSTTVGLSMTAAARASRAVNVAALAGMANGIRAAVMVHHRAPGVAHQAPPWHSLSVERVLSLVDGSPAGLSGDEAARRRRRQPTHGRRSPSLLGSIAAETINPLTPILAGGAAASATVGSVADAGMVAGVSALNAVIGGVQRFGAERAIQTLSDSSGQTAVIRRPEGQSDYPIGDLVVGDVVVLHAGDAVPADCRILACSALQVDESALTGESEPVVKEPAAVFAEAMSERTSMLYAGTTVAAGEAVALAVAVGDDTQMFRMAADVEDAAAGGVEARLRHLTSLTLPVSLGGGATILASSILRRRPVPQSVNSAVALAVAAVPEGLPLLATMAQLAAARRLSERQALVRNPRAIEALGRVRVLCTDKTGTLTEGRSRLSQVSDGVEDQGSDALSGHHATILAAGLRATPSAEGGRSLPHLTDQAVVDAAQRGRITHSDGAAGWEPCDSLPFEPARGYHAVLADTQGRLLLSVKGAPETVIPRCHRWRSPRGDVALDAIARRRLDAKVERMARRGLRILAVAEQDLSGRPDDHLPLTDDHIDDLILLGFLVLSDPVRPTASGAVRGLRRAGVDVVMVTGDHPSTAESIAAELGILNGRRVLAGAELSRMTDAQLDSVIENVSVFARVTPSDKVRIVEALQRRGQAVAMTGDGANDAPAIRLADVGIALGGRSTPAAREAADVVVTDERIETIVDAIVEGRAMWTSVREALAILLGGNLGEVSFMVIATLLTGRTPLSPRQLLVVNLLTDVAPALAIAVRPPAGLTPEDLLAEGPDASLGASLERAILVRAATTASGAGAAWVLASLTGRPRRASTTALVALVGSQLGQTIAGGGLDPLVLAAGVGSALVLAAIVQTPGVSQFFGCTPLGPVAWGIALQCAAVATGASMLGSSFIQVSPTPEAEAAEAPSLPVMTSAGEEAEVATP